MEGRESTLPVWPDPDAELCHTLLKRNREGYGAFLERLDDEERLCSYTNSQKVPFTSTVGELRWMPQGVLRPGCTRPAPKSPGLYPEYALEGPPYT